MSIELATTVAFLGASLIIYLIAESFRDLDLLGKVLGDEDNNEWYNTLFRIVFYVFSLGFVGLAIGANQSYLKVNNITNAQLNDTITAGVTLLVRMQTMFYIIIASITFLIILFKIFDKLKQSQEELDKTYDNWGKK
jgi:hypothetical protein